MIWWYWLLLGLALLAVELITPGGFYILFFGLAALAVGGLTGSGLIEPAWMQWLLFSALSIISLVFFRGPLLARIKSHSPADHPIDTLVGEIAITLQDLAPDGDGKAELRGTTWTAKNAGRTTLSKGQRSRVERVEGLTLWIRAE